MPISTLRSWVNLRIAWTLWSQLPSTILIQGLLYWAVTAHGCTPFLSVTFCFKSPQPLSKGWEVDRRIEKNGEDVQRHKARPQGAPAQVALTCMYDHGCTSTAALNEFCKMKPVIFVAVTWWDPAATWRLFKSSPFTSCGGLWCIYSKSLSETHFVV